MKMKFSDVAPSFAIEKVIYVSTPVFQKLLCPINNIMGFKEPFNQY